MSGFRLIGEWEALKRAFRIVRGLSLRSIHEEIGEAILEGVSRHFEEEMGPDGPWTRSKAATSRDGSRRQGKTLQATGRLALSIAYHAAPKAVEVGTNVVYAAIHQFGGKTGRGHAVELPARPYLYVEGDRETEDEVHDIIGRRIGKPLRAS